MAGHPHGKLDEYVRRLFHSVESLKTYFMDFFHDFFIQMVLHSLFILKPCFDTKLRPRYTSGLILRWILFLFPGTQREGKGYLVNSSEETEDRIEEI